MNPKQLVCLPLALGLAVSGLPGTRVQAEVVFLDGGYAQMCSLAAHNLEEFNRMDITGSRVGLTPLEVCTRAVTWPDTSSYNIAGSYNNRGVLWFSQGDYAQALADFEAALGVDDELAQAYVNRGYTLSILQRWSESIEAYTRGIELGSEEEAKAYFNRGIANEELGKVREAYTDYRMAAELDPLWEAPRLELERFSVKSR